jgi:NAD(P)-dependent dehydrogenase (short-subunit alcohol dehydrogenase family)
MQEISFDGQVAIVTGAGRGLGRAYAVELARRGAAVVVCDIGGVGSTEGSWADSVVAEIKSAGGRAIGSHASVATAEGGEAIVETALSNFGALDIVINNAGFLRTAMFGDMSADQLGDVMNVHLLGSFNVTQPAWRVMRARGYGRVVLTSSSSIFGMQGNSNYAAAKAGLIGLARCLALEGERHNIRINCVLPFAVSDIREGKSHLGPDAGRSALLQEALTHRRTTASVAPLILYLVSAGCAVNGEAYSALAGRYARIFLGLTSGWLSKDASQVTPEQIAERMDEIGDSTNHLVPTSMVDELESVLTRVQELEHPY